MRPKAIVYFEWIIFGTLALGLVQDYLAWDSLVAVAGTVPFLILTQALTFALIITLTLLISRRRSAVAMWISIVLFALGLPAVVALAMQGLLFGARAITAVQTIGQLIAYGLLFTSEARNWMKEGRPSRPGRG